MGKLAQARHLREFIRLLGKEERLKDRIIPEETDGIIPRSFRYIWQKIMSLQERIYIKASFLEIYNEQIIDLLCDKTKPLNCRYNSDSVV